MLESSQPSSNQGEKGKESCSKSQLRRSSRAKYKYESSWKEPEKKKCIICNEDKRVKGRLIEVQTISITDKAQKTLEEYANIHMRNNNEKYIDGARRILLTLSSKSLLAADVAYHKRQCYEAFRSPKWKREKNTTTMPNEGDDDYKEIYQLVKVNIINRKKIYTLSQLKAALDEIKQKSNGSPCRSTDLK